MSPFPDFPLALRLLLLPVKALYFFVTLLWTLIFSLPSGISSMLVATPPAVPVLMVCRFACWLRGWRMIIDWHNLAYTLMGLSLQGWKRRAFGPVVWLARWLECASGHSASGHLTVTNALKEHLCGAWRYPAERVVVLYDRPPALFRPLSDTERREALRMVAEADGRPALREWCERAARGEVRVVFSSTSWTPDEDLEQLLEALLMWEERAAREPGLFAPLLVLITGRGPLRAAYEARLERLRLRYVHVACLWLPAELYGRAVGVAEVGVSLHWSSSGLDLPMKVLDMFGCGVPVLARRFRCLHELVHEGRNGFSFSSAVELFALLRALLAPAAPRLPSEPELPQRVDLAALRSNVIEQARTQRWENTWPLVLPLFS